MKDFYTIDEYGMVLGDGKGHRDSIGRTVKYAIAWQDPTMMEGPLSCVRATKIVRHPSYTDEPDDMSRDHYLWLMIGLWHFKMYDFFRDIMLSTGWRISEKFTQTPDLWLWQRAMLGSKLAEVLFYLIQIPFMLGASVWNWFWTVWGNFRNEMDEEDYGRAYPLPKTKLQEWIIGKNLKRKTLFYPTFALGWTALSVNLMRECWAKEVLLVCMMPMVDKNPALRILCCLEIDKAEIDNYPLMRGGRLSTKLNERDNRWFQILDKTKWNWDNNLDKDFLQILYELYY